MGGGPEPPPCKKFRRVRRNFLHFLRKAVTPRSENFGFYTPFFGLDCLKMHLFRGKIRRAAKILGFFGPFLYKNSLKIDIFGGAVTPNKIFHKIVKIMAVTPKKLNLRGGLKSKIFLN